MTTENLKVISYLCRNGDRYNIQRVPEVVGESGSMLVHFYSDVAYNMTGFNLTFRYYLLDSFIRSIRRAVKQQRHSNAYDADLTNS